MMAYKGQFALGRIINGQDTYQNRFNLPVEVIRVQCLNEYSTCSNRRHYHIDDSSTSLPTTVQHGKRPLIAGFHHPLRKRLREMQSYDLENLLGYGPDWVNKDHLRHMYSAPKPFSSRGLSKSMRSSMSGTTHSISHLESQLYGGKALRLPNATSLIHSYHSGNSVRASSPFIVPVGPVSRSVNRIPNSPALCSVSPSNTRRTKYFPQHKINPKETRNENDVLTKYCQWFDNLSSSILESNIGESKLAGVDESHQVKSKNEDNHQEGLQKKIHRTDYTKRDLDETSVRHQDFNRKKSCCRTERQESESVRKKRGISLINSNEDEKDYKSNADVNEHGQDMKNGDLSQTFQNIPREKVTSLEPKERDFSSSPEHEIGWKEYNKRWGENSDELFVDKLVCIVKNYVKSKRPQDSDIGQCKKDNPKQEEEIKTVKESIIDHPKEKRRKRIELLRKLVAQQESKLAKLKRQAWVDEEQFYEAQEDIGSDFQPFGLRAPAKEDNSVVKNKTSRPNSPGAVSQSYEDGVSTSKKTRLAVAKSTTESKVILKKRWLSDWSCSTADNYVSKEASSI
ncbi:uncharacterized protein LOC116301233 [Actinia tenebrosa]|uniref:Uncharacterized protein LOC116301233 n=1 Tax=Actinia tenebrosa TaxID=6105 RepID=A0A6P8IHG9_ACTTE|nr:uncharacterized protein LOC116301233 [Actinia tenebrosa]